jgi:hypothetical protein
MTGFDPPFSGINVSWTISCDGGGDMVGWACATTGGKPLNEEGAIRIGIESSMGWKRRRARIDILLRLRDQHKKLYVHG